jgi:hypothetical protein
MVPHSPPSASLFAPVCPLVVWTWPLSDHVLATAAGGRGALLLGKKREDIDWKLAATLAFLGLIWAPGAAVELNLTMRGVAPSSDHVQA